jgi:hypothetical protein
MINKASPHKTTGEFANESSVAAVIVDHQTDKTWRREVGLGESAVALLRWP